MSTDLTTQPDLTPLLDDLDAAGIRLWIEAGELRFRAPRGAMTEERRAAVRARRSDLLEHLGRTDSPATPDPAARHEPFPLTPVQAAYLVGRGDAYPWGGTACHAYVELEHPGTTLDPDRMAAAWTALVERHDMLRAVVHPDGHQRVLPATPTTVDVSDLREADAERVANTLAATRAALDHRRTGPDEAPLCLLRLTRCPDRTVLHLSVDLLVVDFTSLQQLLGELAAAYRGSSVKAPELTFRDYVIASRRLADSPPAERDRAYWRGRTLPPAPELPVDGDPDARPVRFRRRAVQLDAAAWERLRERAAAHGVTGSAALLTAYAEVVGRWSRHPRFTLTLPTFTRHAVHPDVERLVGDFTAVELLEVDLTEAVPFAERARILSAQLLDDLSHPLHTGSDVLAELSRAAGVAAGGMLMPVVFTSALDSAPPTDLSLGDGALRIRDALTQTPQVWIDCQALPSAGGVLLSWDCREGVFPAGLLDDAFAAFADLVSRLDLAQTWGDDDPVRLPAGQAAVRAAIDDTTAPLPEGLLHDPVLAQAVETPDAVAVIDASGETTYAELAARAHAVAAALRATEPGEIVAVLMDKGVEQVAAVLGIHLAGGAYLPIGTDQPAARREAVLADAGVRTVLTQSWLGVDGIAVDALPVTAAEVPAPATQPDDLAYVITTSGSTGTPKGVMISHAAALNTVVDVTRRYGVGPGDRVLGLAALGFDLSVYDVFGALAAGATLVLPEPARRGDPSHWAELVAEHGVTVWNSVPGQLQMLHDHLPPGGGAGLASLRVALLSGDWIPVTLPDQIRALVPGLAVHSMGGATEGAIWSIHHPVGEVDPAWPSIPYGVPMTNQTLRALDHRMRPCPDWVPGELYIGGVGVAMGYLNDPDRTAERFPTHAGERLYRTGDLGRHLGAGDPRGQGVLEFLGREDTQVKIRGFRIELAEIEAALHSHPGVGTAAVFTDGERGAMRLAAAVQPARVAPPEPDTTVVERAAAALPPLPVEQAEPLRAFLSDLDAAALAAIAETVAPALPGTAEEVASRLNAPARHHRLLRRWLRALVAGGLATRDGEGRYATAERPDGADVDRATVWTALAEAERELGWSADLLDHVRTCAGSLPRLLDGSLPVADLLFPGAPTDAVRAAYRDTLAVRGLNAAATAAIVERARVRPGIRVLELGAGVGGLTAELVPALAGLEADYLVTDPSAFFVAEARERYADHPWVRHARLDPGTLTGLAPHSADVVVAGNALHRVPDLPAALARIAEVLTSGGLLVIVEQTRDDSPALLASMEFLEALAGDPVDGRGDTAFCSAAEWERLITAAGGRPALVLPADADPLAVLGQRLLIAEVKTDRAPVTPADLVRELGERLPEYMVPTAWQILDTLPHTGNGKVDRAALRALLDTDEAVVAGAEPREGREQELATLWAELLDQPRIGRDDDFFALGGDSLLVARLVGRLRETEPGLAEIEWDVVLRHLLRRPTVAGLAEYLDGLATRAVTAAQGPVRAVVDLHGSVDAETVTVLVHAGVGTIMPYRALVTEIRRRSAGTSRLVGLEVPDLDAFLDAEPTGLVERLAAGYARELLDTGARRFHVVGYCLGGLIATEVARTLTEAGADVASFTAISSHAPAFRLEDELLSEYSFAVMMGADAVELGFPTDAALFAEAASEVLQSSPGVLPDGALAALGGRYAPVAKAFEELGRLPRARRVERLCAAVPASVGTFSPPQLLRMFRTFRQSVFALTRYRPEEYLGDVAFLRHGGPYPFPGSRDSVTRYWEELCLGELTVVDIDGDHFTCLADDRVPAVLAHLVELTGGEVLG